MQTNKRKGYLISGIFILILTLTILFLIFLFMHPKVYFSKASGFSQHDGIRFGKNKLRFVVPETVDVTKSTFIHVKQEWFTTNRLGRITAIKAKPYKYLALDFTDREYNSEIFTIYTKNLFGITREHDVIVDYSNFLRIFFPVPNKGETARKPIILPYSKLKTTYMHIYEELLKINTFYAFDEKGHPSGQPISKEDVFTKENAKGRAFIVNNNSHISLIYDFLLSGIFKNQTQKTQIYEFIEKTVDKIKTLDPEKHGFDIKLNTPPFYISKFLGWYYIDPSGNRVDLKPGQEFQIPKWVKSELRLIARYDITTDTDKIGPELDKQGLVAISYFDGVERVFFDIVKKGSPLKEHVYQKPGYTYEGWYKDSSLTKKIDFATEVANTHTVLYLKSTKQNQPHPEKPIKYHTINFITPVDANQLLSTRRAHGQKLETNYLTPSLVSRIDENGNLEELDYWNLVDPITGVRTRYDFNTPITEDITLEAVMRKRVAPKTKYTIKRYYESVDQNGSFIEDKTKEEIIDGQTPSQVVELLPTQAKAPYGFTLDNTSVLKKKIKADGTTVFELKYKRNRYKVNFEVNYNGNHFKDVNIFSTPEQTVPYEGKLTRPSNPTIAKPGYTYTFKHWQLKDEMGNVYKEVSEFDFNTKITKNTTLVAYFEEKKDTATYTVQHIFQGIQNQIEERIEERKFTEQVGKSVTVTQQNRDKSYDQHFEVTDFSETKKVEADGSTVFEIRYIRKKYKVNFEVNFNGNNFSGVISSIEPEQTIPYEGKVKQPQHNPTMSKSGFTYTFKHWQLKDDMGNVYKEVDAFNFSSNKIIKNTTLVAYFVEKIENANYTIKHIYKGFNSIQDIVETEVKQAQVGSQVTVTEADARTREGFEVQPVNETKTINANGQTIFTLTYERKVYSVEYDYNGGTLNGESKSTESYKFEENLRDIEHPKKTDPTQIKTYTFAGWQNIETGEIVDFSKNLNVTKNLYLKATWTEATATRPVCLKMIWEKINEQIDTVVERQLAKQREIGDTAKFSDQDVQDILNQYLVNNPRPYHETNFDIANSTTEVRITTSLDKHYITVYFKAKTYTVEFDRTGLVPASVAPELKQTLTLKHSQTVPSDLIAKMKLVQKQQTATSDYVFDKLVETTTSQDFNENLAYNQNIKIKPVFIEKDAQATIIPKLSAGDTDKADASAWRPQNGKVGTKFDFNPQQSVKKGWKFVGWAKAEGNPAETIYFERGTKEVWAVFEPAETTYTIRHVFKGIEKDNIPDDIKTTVNSAKTNSVVQLNNSHEYSSYNKNGFIAQLPPQSEIIKADGTTVFEITYQRREFDVNFVVNYKNQFDATVSPVPQTQKIKYEGKVEQPNENPTIKKKGRTYQFIHWQTEVSMNGTYSEQNAYDFLSKVTNNLTLVAYFKETIDTVNYKVVHKLEKQGKENTLDGKYDEVTEIIENQKVEDGAVYKKYSALNTELYEKDDNHPENILTAPLTTGNNNTVVRQYYKLREITVEFKETDGIKRFKSANTIKVKKTRSIPLPEYELKDTHKFIGWALSSTGATQSEFIASGNFMQIYAKTDFQDRNIIYTIKTQKTDSSYTESTEIKSGKIGSIHAVTYLNPNSTVYQNPQYSTENLTVNADETQNKVTITINRKTYTVQYEVKGTTTGIADKTFLHGAEHGEIDETNFQKEGLEISRIELDGDVKTKEEIKNLKIEKNHKITVYVDEPSRKIGKYPQTKVDNPVGIRHIETSQRELKFKVFNKDYTKYFNREYYEDTAGNKYEKYNGQYYKFEDVEFIKIPYKNTWFTKRIIDYSPFNVYYADYSIPNEPKHSILKAMVDDIGKVIGEPTYMPSRDGNDDFGVIQAVINKLYKKMQKTPTDYAKAVLTQYTNADIRYYRSINFLSFLERDIQLPHYRFSSISKWWLGTSYRANQAYSINRAGNVDEDYYMHVVFGVVVCIR